MKLKHFFRNTKSIVITLFIIGITTYQVPAQVKLGNNPQTVQISSILELETTQKGLLLPRVNTTQMNAIPVTQGMTYPTSSNGLIVYNTDSACICYYNGNGWRSLCNTYTLGMSVVNYQATIGEITFTTPYTITDLKKVVVYRNAMAVNFKGTLGGTSITLDFSNYDNGYLTGCMAGDQIKIYQWE